MSNRPDPAHDGASRPPRKRRKPRRADRATHPPTPPRAGTGPHAADGVYAEFYRKTPEGDPAAIRIQVQPFNGVLILHLRQWERKANGDWFPTKLGITLRVSEIDEAIAALGTAKLALVSDADRYARPDRRRQAPRLTAPADLGTIDPPRPETEADARERSIPPWEHPRGTD